MDKVTFTVPGIEGIIQCSFYFPGEARIFRDFLREKGVEAELFITTVKKVD
jgi:hypothetical protein